jgi:ketosteroid isomerase-like protein
MKQALWWLFALAAPSLVFAQAPRGNPAEAELRQIEEARSQAIKQGDMKTLDRIYTDDFSGIIGNARVLDKAQLFELFKATDPRLVFAVDELRVRVYTAAAVMTGRLTAKKPDGAVLSASRFTHFFVKQHGEWRIVAGQSTLIPNSQPAREGEK